MMKKILIIFLFLVMVSSVFSKLPTITFKRKLPIDIKLCIDTLNETYTFLIEYLDENKIKIDIAEDLFQELSTVLLGILFYISIIKKLNKIERMTIMDFISPLVLIAFALVLLDNLTLIYDIASSVTKDLTDKLSPNKQLIPIEQIEKLYFKLMPNRFDPIAEMKVGLVFVFLILSFALSIATIGGVLLLRLVTLKMLQILAPIAIIMFSSKLTFNHGFNFLKKYFSVHLQVFLIQLSFNVILQVLVQNTLTLGILMVVSVGSVLVAIFAPSLLKFKS